MVIGIVVILISILVPYVMKKREDDRRVRCAENLRMIMAALRTYSAGNHGDFPRVVYDPVANPNGYAAFSGAASADPFAHDTRVRPNDVTASLWLLVRGRMVKPAQLVCPSASDRPDPADPSEWGRRSNFSGPGCLSYSYACPFSSAPGYKLNDYLPADFALVADKNPGVSSNGSDVTAPAYDAPPFEIARANSNNHERAGQNVLYTDGHVSFQATPYCGVGHEGLRDNIYTALSRGPLPKGQTLPVQSNGVIGRDVAPAWERDSYLVPTAQD